MNIVVVGTGYVGLVAGACLAKIGHQATCVDIDEEKIKNLKEGKIPIYEPGLSEVVKKEVASKRLSFSTSLKDVLDQAEVVFVAVGTPMRRDGKADLQYVEAVAKEIGQNIKDYKVIVNKSTVPVGTGKEVTDIIAKYYKGSFDVVSNPEFLREGSAVEDFMKPDRIVIGAGSNKARDVMLEVYEPLDYKKITVSIESAEMIKYASNAFLATKISFINEVANICDIVDADVEDVARGMGLDNRIGPKFLKAGIGYGGSCFPKDVNALNQIAGTSGYDFKLLKAVIEVNIKQRLLVIDKLEELLDQIKDQPICVLGLAFKANTDDIRESAAVDIIRTLTGLGANISTYDPEAAEQAKEIMNGGVKFFDDPYEATKDAKALVVATEWPEFKKLDYKKVASLMANPKILIDGRNILEPEEMRKLGFKYVGVGRGKL
ncbi:MAG: UDP-glucose/GDP-mannose dehydrogenase family protein [Parcubacteria group bacterium]|nr:UDP-glucose/GDP-mannose dehydrogenase family protein [Parcubacteria group bacterium]